MLKWLRMSWVSPGRHEEIVEELSLKITRLEADYVELARAHIAETEARRAAERVRDILLKSSRPGTIASDGNVFAPLFRRS